MVSQPSVQRGGDQALVDAIAKLVRTGSHGANATGQLLATIAAIADGRRTPIRTSVSGARSIQADMVFTGDDDRMAIDVLPQVDLQTLADANEATSLRSEPVSCSQSCEAPRIPVAWRGLQETRRHVAAKVRSIASKPAQNLASEPVGIGSEDGSGDWTRTSDLRVMNPPL